MWNWWSPLVQFVASLCFPLEFSEFLLHSQRLVDPGLDHHSQLCYRVCSGVLTNFWTNGTTLQFWFHNLSVILPSTLPHSQISKLAFFYSSINMQLCNSLFYFNFVSPEFADAFHSKGRTIWHTTFLAWLLVAVSLWGSYYFSFCLDLESVIVHGKKSDILKQQPTPSRTPSLFLSPCSHPEASKD